MYKYINRLFQINIIVVKCQAGGLFISHAGNKYSSCFCKSPGAARHISIPENNYLAVRLWGVGNRLWRNTAPPATNADETVEELCARCNDTDAQLGLFPGGELASRSTLMCLCVVGPAKRIYQESSSFCRTLEAKSMPSVAVTVAMVAMVVTVWSVVVDSCIFTAWPAIWEHNRSRWYFTVIDG